MGRTHDLNLANRKWERWRNSVEVIRCQISWFWVTQVRDYTVRSWLNQVKAIGFSHRWETLLWASHNSGHDGEEALIAQNYRRSLGTVGNLQAITSIKLGSPSYSNKEINSGNNLNGHEGSSSPMRPPNENIAQPMPWVQLGKILVREPIKLCPDSWPMETVGFF